MLDAQTKSRIDSARDVLVGKIPDPKSQVEQITIAMIYKFMDDLDTQSEELGGKATFFTGDFKKYAWHRLLDPKLGGHERLVLYAEGMEKMVENKNIPQLFRDIFKGAFLPYRDPETLNLFLKEVNGFVYDHSERLGDAFEYLLSVLGSQGDAGQFRTPRHIIDFIVRIVDPKKTETVLDPACGTAGFLISAYKHILNSNKKEKTGDKLSGDERKRLIKNFCGYDIAPDMTRLSRANMYLHGFKQPEIHEYDTLTSEDRWDERWDIILANPPFMTPKGGIRPHNRFSIKASRSEVLFVDYIAEHLNVNGRAGVIVPEGVIFQSQNAYKQLREMLVKEYLWGVVSLPAGVFNPYSGVKTSILLMDKALKKKNNDILFVKINSDGFDLGAQRREIESNDLPEAEKIITEWRDNGKINEGELAVAVPRKKILESSDIGLTGDRYKVSKIKVCHKYPIVKLGDICEIGSSKRVFESEWKREGVPFYRAREIVKLSKDGYVDNDLFISEEMFREYSKKYGYPKEGDLMVTGVGTLGICYQVKKGDRFYFKDGNIIWLKNFRDTVDSSYIKYMYDSSFVIDQINANATGGTVGTYTITNANNTLIPLPSLDIQKEIVAELDGYRKQIEETKIEAKRLEHKIKDKLAEVWGE